jgi:outer membrane protein assembly factor BamC
LLNFSAVLQDSSMKFAFLRLAVCSLAVVLAGCSTLGIESKKIDYKSSSSVKVPTLEIPPDLTSPARDDRFAVPESSGKGSATFSAYSGERSPQARAQQQSDILPQVDKARIERAGSQRWLVVSGTPDKLWGSVKDFWQEMGFVINIERPEAGVMETDWAENRAKIGEDMLRNFLGKVVDSLYSTSERDKFRTRFEPGSEPGTVDIFISHRGMYEIYVSEARDQTRWQPREVDPELEAEMLRRLMVSLGTDQKRAEVVMAQAKAKPVERAKLTRSNDGAGTLDVQESFDRAWRRVGLALDRVGFTVEDRDRSKGLYFVRYVDPETDGQKKDDGFLSKLVFWKGAAPDPQTKYRIFVKEGGALTTVQVLSFEGGVDQSETSKKILSLLYEQLK